MMTPVLSLVEGRLRALLVERRKFARKEAVYEVELPVGVSVPNEKLNPEAERYPNPILGRTREVSESGLSMFLPSVMLGEDEISVAGYCLRIVLSLPGGIAVVQAVTVHAEEVRPPQGERGFIIGVRIMKMSVSDEKRYQALVQSLIGVFSCRFG